VSDTTVTEDVSCSGSMMSRSARFPQWTDLVAPDAEIVLGECRALFRVADLLELERLVDQLRKRDSWKRPDNA
jgi:hypothetical protein